MKPLSIGALQGLCPCSSEAPTISEGKRLKCTYVCMYVMGPPYQSFAQALGPSLEASLGPLLGASLGPLIGASLWSLLGASLGPLIGFSLGPLLVAS